MSRLNGMMTDASFSAAVRDAAQRSWAPLTADFGYPDAADPLADARAIIAHVRGSIHVPGG